MCPAISNQCLTRVVCDDEGVEVAHLHDAMQRIENSLLTIPREQRSVVASALLKLAIVSMAEHQFHLRHTP